MDGHEAVQQISAARQPPGHRGARRGSRAIMAVPLAPAVVAVLLEAAARDEPGDPDAAGQAGKRAIGSGELDRELVPALARLALGLLGPQARRRPADAAWLGEVAAVLGQESWPPAPGEPPWPDAPLTRSETRVLRYLPTHLSAREIAAELGVSVNTVKTHVRHLYGKLGAHGRHDAVCRARAIGLLATSRGVRGRESHALPAGFGCS